MIFQLFLTLFNRECHIYISRDLVCYKFTTAERCSKFTSRSQKDGLADSTFPVSDFSENITSSTGVVISQFI